jgi:hypothetical protein
MAEVGLVRFAGVALEVAEAVLLYYRSKISKHIFTQPQLLAVLCLMRYENWTLRKAPDHTMLYSLMRRLDEQALVATLNETVRRLAASSHAQPEEESAATVAVNATGLSPGAVSTFYVRHTQPRLRTNALAQVAEVAPGGRHETPASAGARGVLGSFNGSAMLRPLIEAAREVAPLSVVLADAEFDK